MKTTSTFSMLALAAATLAVTVSSCSKKDNPAPEMQVPEPEDEGVPLSAPSAAEFARLQQEALAKMTTTKTLAPGDYVTSQYQGKWAAFVNFTSDRKTVYSWKSKPNTAPLTGDIDFVFTEIYGRGDMLLANRPLMGNNSAGKIVPLVSGGQFFWEGKQGNEILEEDYNIMIVPGSLTGGYSPVSGHDPATGFFNPQLFSPTDDKMKAWKGNIGNDGNIGWEVNIPYGLDRQHYEDENGGVVIENGIRLTTDDYRFFPGESPIKWTAIGRFYVPNGQTTKMKVSVPDGYNAQNAKVYLAYEGEKYLLAQLYSYDAAGKHFTEPEGFVPEGKKVHAIFVSESEGKFVHAVKTVSVTANAEIAFAHEDLATIDADKLADKVNALD